MSKVVDADRINFKDFVDEVVETNPHGYGELVKVYYWALDTVAGFLGYPQPGGGTHPPNP